MACTPHLPARRCLVSSLGEDLSGHHGRGVQSLQGPAGTLLPGGAGPDAPGRAMSRAP